MKTLKLSLVILLVLTFFQTFVFAKDTLLEYDSKCNSYSKSRNSHCVAAAYRFCSDPKAYRGAAGIIQEIKFHGFGVACFAPSNYSDVSLKDLTALHPGCNDKSLSQHPACVSAVHRWCTKTGNGNAGIVQEVKNGVFGVACINAQVYQDVSINALTATNRGCNSSERSQEPDCVSAIHRWCVNNGKGNAGLAQETESNVFGVACFQATWYGDVYLDPVPPPQGGGD